MKRFAIAFCLLLLTGCDKAMTLDEQLDATKKCHATGGTASLSVNILFQSFITCYPHN